MKPDDITTFISLPWATLLVLVSGYIGYNISYYGLRENHKPLDMIFIILAFGYVGGLFYNIALSFCSANIFYMAVASLLAIAIVSSLAFVWRRYLRNNVEPLIRKFKISYKNNNMRAWDELSEKPGYSISQITVYLKNGDILTCDNTYDYQIPPNGSHVLGGTGDILMYVTRKKIGGVWVDIEKEEIINDWGNEMTYIPASEISYIDLRRKLLSKS